MANRIKRKPRGRDGGELKKLRNLVVELAGYTRDTHLSTQAVIRAIVEVTGTEDKVREVLQRYDAAAKAAQEVAAKAEAGETSIHPHAWEHLPGVPDSNDLCRHCALPPGHLVHTQQAPAAEEITTTQPQELR